MSISDMFKGKKYREELEKLQSILTPELQTVVDIHDEISRLQSELENLKSEAVNQNADLTRIRFEIAEKHKEVVFLDDEILVQEFGLYQPRYEFSTVQEYKEALDAIRQKQKTMIKNGTAVNGATNWTVNGNDYSHNIRTTFA